MIKNGIKNFFINLKYFFTPLGAMFLGIIIGVSFLIPGVMQAISSLVDGVKALGENLNLDFKVLWNMLWDQIVGLNWEMPNEALEVILSDDWLHRLLTSALETILGTDFEVFKLQIEELISSFMNMIQLSILSFILWWVLGYFLGFLLLKFLVRRNIARRKFAQYFLNVIINAVLSVALVVGCMILLAIWTPSIFITFVLIFLFIGFISLLSAFLVYGRKKIPFKKIVNIKNIGAYYLTIILILIIAGAITLLIVIINALLGLFVGLSVLAIAFLVISMNAESYVIEIVKKEAFELKN